MTTASNTILGGLLGAAVLVAFAIGLGAPDAERTQDGVPAANNSSAETETDDITAGLPEFPLPDIDDVATISTPTSGEMADRAALREEMRAYLLENPEVLVEAMQVLEQRRLIETEENERLMVSQLAPQIYDDGFSYVGGNPDGDVTLVEFWDYRCGFCKRAHAEVQELVRSDGNIRMVVKEFPILGPDSTLTSRIAISALINEGPEAYKRLSDAMMTYGGPINDAAIDRLAKSADVDIDAIRADLENPEIDRRISETMNLARSLQVSGTPTFIIGSKVVRGYLPLDEMREVVALSRSLTE